MNSKDVEDFLLVSQQGEVFGIEGIALKTEVSTDHRRLAG